MNSKKNKAFYQHSLLLNLTNKTDFQRGEEGVAL